MVNRGKRYSIFAVAQQTRTIFSLLLDLVFPPFCISCRTIGPYICDSCAGGFPWIDSRFCLRCGLPLEAGQSHGCIDPSRLQFVRSAAIFSGVMRRAVHALKYYSDRALAYRLVQLANRRWNLPTWEFDALLPVPLGISIVTGTPKPADEDESRRLINMEAGTYCVGLTVTDESGNQSTLSNIAEVTTPGSGI